MYKKLYLQRRMSANIMLRSLFTLFILSSTFFITSGQSCHESNRKVSVKRNLIPRDSLLVIAKQAVKVCSVSENVAGHIVSLHNLSQIYSEFPNKADSALVSARLALHIYRANLNNSLFHIKLLQLIGVAFGVSKNIDSSLYYLKEAIFIFQKDTLLNSGSQASIDHYLEINNQILTTYLEAGYYNEVQEAFSQIEATIGFKVKRSPQYLYTLNNYGAALQAKGEYSHSIAVYQTALELWEALPEKISSDSILYSKLLNNIGNSYLKQGSFNKALTFFERSQRIKLCFFSQDDPEYVVSLDNIAALYMKLDRFENARDSLSKALIIAKKFGNDNPIYLNVLNNISQAYIGLKQYKVAKYTIRKQLKLLKGKTLAQQESRAIALTNLAMVYKEEKRFNKALRWNAKSLRTINRLPQVNPEIISLIRNNQASINSDLGRTKKAIMIYRDVLALFSLQYPNDIEDRIIFLNNLSTVYAKMGLYDSTLKLLAEASILFHKQVKNKASVLSEDEKSNYALRLDNIFQIYKSYYNSASPELRKSYAGAIFKNELLLKSFVLSTSQKIKEGIESSSDTLLFNWYRDWKKLKIEIHSLPSLQNKQEILQSKIQQVNLLERSISERSFVFADWLQQFDLDHTTLLAHLKEGETIVEYIFNREFNSHTQPTGRIIYSAILLNTKLRQPIVIPLCLEADLDSALQLQQEDHYEKERIGRIYGSATQGVASSVSRRLYKLLWAPLLPYLEGSQKLFVIPVKKTNIIALQALREDSTYIIDKYAIIQLQNSRSILNYEGDDFTIKQLKEDSAKTVLVGGISYSASRTNSLSFSNDIPYYSPLPYSKQEIHQIDSTLSKANVYTEIYEKDFALEGTLKSLSGSKTALLHISTHGFFNHQAINSSNKNIDIIFKYAANPLLRTGLLFTGANAGFFGFKGEDSEDGILTAEEVSMLDFSQVKLVVLSACETGIGDIRNSEGLYGLQRAFKLAGVKYIIASLWRISDKGTYEFMRNFYINLSKGMQLESAFRKTQLDMKANYDPYYWAPFVLYK